MAVAHLLLGFTVIAVVLLIEAAVTYFATETVLSLQQKSTKACKTRVFKFGAGLSVTQLTAQIYQLMILTVSTKGFDSPEARCLR
ncbi:unnamed protein product [Coffea canephora]|uniref:Uncharacterized protein n=1 Tax=Coffea canephora TaxID=49390 RepID=A0A068UL62_COFCA|nr:unnamed protein product [Coffea canephora]